MFQEVFLKVWRSAEAVLTSAVSANPQKRLGLLEGKLAVPDDFDAPLPPELIAAFEGDGQ